MSGADVMPLPPNVERAAYELSTDLARVTATINFTQVAMDTAAGTVPGWAGQSADAYNAEVTTLGTHARELAGVLPVPINALRDWADAVKKAIRDVQTLQELYDEAQSSYDKKIDQLKTEAATALQQNQIPGVIPDAVSIANRAADARHVCDQIQADAVFDYKRIIRLLDEDASITANAVRGPLDAYIDPDTVGRGRNAISTALFYDMPMVSGQASWEHAQKVIAPAIAKVIRDTDLTDAEIQTFQDKYGPMLSDPFVANALMELVTAEELYAFVVRLWPDLSVSTNIPEVRESILCELGEAMVLSTGGVNLNSPAQVSFERVRDGLLGANGETMSELVAAQISEYQSAGRTPFDKVYGDTGYSLFSQLTGAAAQRNTNLALGAAFYQEHDSSPSMAADMVAWDHEVGEGAATSWAGRFGKKIGLVVGTDISIMDPLHSMYLLSDTPGSLCAASDPLFWSAEKHRLEALRIFLDSDTSFGVDPTGGVNDDTSDPMNMTQYLTGHRISNEFSGFQDGGEAFGDMIADASRPDLDMDWTDPKPGDYPGGKDDPAYLEDRAAFDAMRRDDRRRAAIAAHFMIGYQDGLDGNYEGPSGGAKDGENTWGHVSSRLRSWAGTIIAPHLDGVAASLSVPPNKGNPTDPSFVASEEDGSRAMVEFNDDYKIRFLNRGGLFEDLAFDAPTVIDSRDPDNPLDDEYEGGRRPALETLRMTAQSGYTRDLSQTNTLPTYASQLQHLKNANNKWATVINALYAAPAGAEEAAAIAMDERNSAWQSGIGAIVDLVPYSNLIDNQFVVWTIGQGKTYLPDFLNLVIPADHASQIASRFGEQSSAAATWMKVALYSEIARADTFMDENGAYYIDPATTSNMDPDLRFIDENGKILPWDSMTPEQQGSFVSYITKSTDHSHVVEGLDSALTAAQQRRH